MPEQTSVRFKSIIEAARNRTAQGDAETMVVSGHLAQQRMFMTRQGVEFYPKQDTFGHRKTFLQALVLENEVDARLEGVVDDFLLDGKGLWFFRPAGDSYRIMWFPKSQYRAYYDALEEIEEVHLIYQYKVKPGAGIMADAMGGAGQEKWVKLVVRRDMIVETLLMSRPPLDEVSLSTTSSFGRTRTVRNSLGFIPAVEAFNNMKSTGKDATGEFDWMESQIVTHDEMVSNIRENLRFFGNPTLVTSRSKSDVIEATGSTGTGRPTISSQAGFAGAGRASTRSSAPYGSSGGRGGFKIPRLITNLEGNDRVAYITPDAVSGDQNLYARQYREELRTALGGVDELGITSGATAYEIKSLFGRAAATSARKCRGLITYGICKLFDLIIYNEERVFRESFAAAIKVKKPQAPLEEDGLEPKKFRKEAEAFDEAMAKYELKLDAAIQKAIEAQQIPPGVLGLIPDGDRQVDWRWRGPVFEDSTDDILNKSIVVRNLQELGVASVEALRHLFPDKTDEERSAMLTGFPFRMAQQTQSSIATFLSLVAQMQQTPHPQAPNVPLLADPRLDLTPYLYRALDFLKRELTYAGTYRDASGYGDPSGLNAFEHSRLERGLPARTGSAPAVFVPDPTGPWATGSAAGAPGVPAGQSMGAGPARVARLYDRDAQLPPPGATIASDPMGDAWLSGANGSILPSGGVWSDGAPRPIPATGLLPPAGAAAALLPASRPGTAAARASGAAAGGPKRRRVPGRTQ
jgi:hypothetical protein